MDLGRPAQGQEEEVLALDVREHQRARKAVDDVSRGGAAAPLLEPGVPRGADVGALRDFFAPQARRTPPFQGEAERGRVELPPAVLQVRAEQVLLRGRHTHPRNHYTGITSLLYLDIESIENALQTATWRFACASSSPARPASSAPPSSKSSSRQSTRYSAWPARMPRRRPSPRQAPTSTAARSPISTACSAERPARTA